MPAYIRGKTGTVVSESPAYPFPDAAAHGVASADEPTYDVRFSSSELWPSAADAAFVHVAVFQSYLERAPVAAARARWRRAAGLTTRADRDASRHRARWSPSS